VALSESAASAHSASGQPLHVLVRPTVPLIVLMATEEEARAHESMLTIIAKASGGKCLWQPAALPAAALEQNLSSA